MELKVIGTNKAGATETVATFMSDVSSKLLPDITPLDLSANIKHKSIKYYSIDDWKKQVDFESKLGKNKIKPD